MRTQLTSRTFAVADVNPATHPLPEIAPRDAYQQFLQISVEACSRPAHPLVACSGSHPLILALHYAFAYHHPLVLSPDIIWLTLCQGFSQHVNRHAETLRSRLVAHEGRQVLTVRRTGFIKGSPENDWPGVFSEFSAQLRHHLGETHTLLLADFSTTGPIERAASELVLMEAMQAYFEYRLMTTCGIPSITLEGTVADWISIAQRVRQFDQFDLTWWTTPLIPVLDQFVAAARGEIDRDFWDSIYKWHGRKGSGSPFVSGWIQKLFPYLLDYSDRLRPNPWINTELATRGPDTPDFTITPARVPFVWEHLRTTFDMVFVGGLMGVTQDPATLSLKPSIGWAVSDPQQPRTQPADGPRVLVPGWHSRQP